MPDNPTSKLNTASFTFQKIELFCRVVALRSVTKAAEEAGIAQPAVTAQLRTMERKLGVQLVYREGRSIALTDAGYRFYRWCEETITRCSELARELSGVADGTSGTAVITASMTAGTYRLSDLLIRYRQSYPNSVVTTQIGNTRAATEAVRTGACDFAVLLLDPQQDIEELELQLLWEDELLLVAAPEKTQLLSIGESGTLSSLPFITSPRNLLRRSLEDDQLYSAGVLSRQVVMELGHPEAIKRAVKKGLGYTFIESCAVQEDLGTSLSVIPTPGISMKLPVYLAKRKDKRLSEMQLKLMDFVIQEGRRLSGYSV